MINASPKIEQLFESIDITLKKLEKLEKNYIDSKERYNKALTFYVRELAALSDRHSIRAEVMRELYWNKRIALPLLQDAFGLTPSRIRRLAGSQAIEFPCVRKCGNAIRIVAKSMFSLASEDYYKNTSYYNTCDECKKLDNLASEQNLVNAKKKISLRQRGKKQN